MATKIFIDERDAACFIVDKVEAFREGLESRITKCVVCHTPFLMPVSIKQRYCGLICAGKAFRKNNPTAKRNADIFRLSQTGATMRNIAEIYDLSVNRVSQICKKMKILRDGGKQ